MLSHKVCAVKAKWVLVDFSSALVLNLHLLLILWLAQVSFELSRFSEWHVQLFCKVFQTSPAVDGGYIFILDALNLLGITRVVVVQVIFD